ncbi:MAG: tetratricopeptide repeat protein, partial [bacterium]
GPGGAGIPAYKLCAERYKDSSFAPLAIAKVIDFYIGSKDFVQANALLEQVFIDYPDADFLASMLLKWTLVAFQSGDYGKALEKCQMLISQYPDSPHAAKGKDILPKVQQKVSGSAGAGGGTESSVGTGAAGQATSN